MSRKELEKVTKDDALAHPNWKMGKKITIDSATMMNKGFEVLEAKWLFDVDLDKIKVVLHHQSIVHSMVEFNDGSVIAQMSNPDMKLPIGYVLFKGERMPLGIEPLDLSKIGTLTFEDPDKEVFPCLEYAYEAGRIGGTYPVALNAANEVLVEAFLMGTIGFTDIQNNLRDILDTHKSIQNPDYESIIQTDHMTRVLISNKLRNR